MNLHKFKIGFALKDFNKSLSLTINSHFQDNIQSSENMVRAVLAILYREDKESGEEYGN